MKNVFCDRDGTIIYDKHYLGDPDGVDLLPGAAAGLARLAGAATADSPSLPGSGATDTAKLPASGAGLRLFLVSNQSGIGRGFFSEADYAACHSRLEELLADAGVHLSGSAFCPHAPAGQAKQAETPCDCRKPNTGMWRTLSAQYGLKAAESAMIGDKPEDLLFAVRAGFAVAVLVQSGKGRESAARLKLPELEAGRDFMRLDGIGMGEFAGSGTVIGLARDLEAAADFLLTLRWQSLAANFSTDPVSGEQSENAEFFRLARRDVFSRLGLASSGLPPERKSKQRSQAEINQRFPSRIAVWNTAFLGDAVLTLPLIQTLHRAFPLAGIDFYTRKGFATLFASHPALHAVYEYDKRQDSALPDMLRFGRTLRSRGYDLFICAHPSPRSAILARLSGAGRRIGYRFNLARLFFTDLVDRKFGSLPEIERLLRLTLPLGLEPADWDLWPKLVLPPEAIDAAESLFAGLRSDAATGTWPEQKIQTGAATRQKSNFDTVHRPVLGLHPGSVWGSKRWPPEYFAEIGLRALRQGAQVLLFGGPGEEDMAKAVEDAILAGLGNSDLTPDGAANEHLGNAEIFRLEIYQRLLNLAGKLTLPELAACLKRLDCYLTNDSGPMHLAWAGGTPVVALFGPTVPEFGFAPRGEKAVVLEVAGLHCRPCGLHGPQSCPAGHHACMRKLTPDLVWRDVRKNIVGS